MRAEDLQPESIKAIKELVLGSEDGLKTQADLMTQAAVVASFAQLAATIVGIELAARDEEVEEDISSRRAEAAKELAERGLSIVRVRAFYAALPVWWVLDLHDEVVASGNTLGEALRNAEGKVSS